MNGSPLPPPQQPQPANQRRTLRRQLSTGPILLALALGVGAWVLRLPAVLWPQVLRGGRGGAETLTGWPHVIWELGQHAGRQGHELWIAIGVVAMVSALAAYYSTAVRGLVYIVAMLLAVADIALFVGIVAVIYSDALKGVGQPGK